MIDKEMEILKKIELRKEAGCKMLECGIIDKNIELNKKIIELKKIEEAHRETNGELREELKKKEEYIHTMQAEFDRLEGIEDNTAMLKYEKEQLEKSLCEHDEIIARLEEENTRLKELLKGE